MTTTFKYIFLSFVLLVLFPMTNYAQTIGADTVKFVGERYVEFGFQKAYSKKTITIFPDSTFEQNDYFSVGKKCKLDIDKSKPNLTKGFWFIKNDKIYFYSTSDKKDSDLTAIFKIKSDQLINKWKKCWRLTKKYKTIDRTKSPFKVIAEKPIKHYIKKT